MRRVLLMQSDNPRQIRYVAGLDSSTILLPAWSGIVTLAGGPIAGRRGVTSSGKAARVPKEPATGNALHPGKWHQREPDQTATNGTQASLAGFPLSLAEQQGARVQCSSPGAVADCHCAIGNGNLAQ